MFALLLPLAASMTTTAGAQTQFPAELTNSQVAIEYVAPVHGSYSQIYDRLRQRRVLEELQAFLSPLRMPVKVLVRIEECGAETVSYKKGAPVTICYERVATIERLAPQSGTLDGIPREDAIVGAFVQAVLHDVAYALFDVMGVPVLGRAEDAADKLAAFIMLQFGRDIALRALTGASWFFEASQRTWTGSDFSDVAGSDKQRFYNYLCIAYGGDPQLFAPLVRNTLLKTGRAVGCAKEYGDVLFAFRRTILPYVNLDLLERVRQVPWLRPDDGKGI